MGYHFTLRLKDGTVETFAAYIAPNPHSGGLQSIVDRYGNTVTFNRDGSGNLTEATSPNGRHLYFSYDGSNRVTTITDDIGRKVSYSYNSNGTLASVTNPLNQTESYAYDPNTLNLLTVTDKLGNVMVTNTYYANTGNSVLDGRVKSQTYADGSTSGWVYNFVNGAVAYTDYTDERGAVRRTAFDGNSNISFVIQGLGTSLQELTSYTRDPVSSLLTQKTDPLGRVTAYTWDSNGNQTSVTKMAGTSQAVTWNDIWDDVYGVMTSSTDPLGTTTTMTYDTYGDLLQTTDPLGHQVTRTWNPDGQLASVSTWPVTGAYSITTRYAYQNGDLRSVTDPLHRTTTFNVDEEGRIDGIVNPAGQIWTTQYDTLDRVIQNCDPANQCASRQYDANDNLTQFTKGSTQRNFSYDSRNRLLTEGRGSVVEDSWAYPPDYLHTTLTEASGRTVTTTLDTLGRTTTVQLSAGAQSSYHRTLSYFWDTADRLQSIGDSSTSYSMSWGYDPRSGD